MYKHFLLLLHTLSLTLLLLNSCAYQTTPNQIQATEDTTIYPAATLTADYLPLLKDKKIALVANHTSTIGTTHIADSLLSLGINITKIFGPEHGFRGNLDAGENFADSIDATTGIKVISLYGNKKKPSNVELQDIDIVIFDIQDVGVRFYTYISTLHYVMQACAENNIPLMILDRPNPNGFYVDGPILEEKNSSFVGMHPVPLVHGMTIAEYAQMINQMGWLGNGLKCKLNLVLCKGYTHQSFYSLPIKPSPNLQDMESIYLYPSLGLLEGTALSMGRGTDFPFKVYGHPQLTDCSFSFTPTSRKGSVNPIFKDKQCFGIDLSTISIDSLQRLQKVELTWIIDGYNRFPDKSKFFNTFFIKLSGTATLRKQIESGMNAQEIKDTWLHDINQFKEIRKKFLLYPDFE